MRLAQLRAHLGLITLLTLGVALRVFLMLEYQPAALSNPDSGRFLYFAHDGERLFTDNYGPAGYEALLRGLRLVTTRLEATVALQHLFGIAADQHRMGMANRVSRSVRVVRHLPVGGGVPELRRGQRHLGPGAVYRGRR